MISPETQLVAQEFVFMQDKDPKYASKLSQKYIKTKEEKDILQLMSWPGQSADLNPIELGWDELNWKVRAKLPTSVTHL